MPTSRLFPYFLIRNISYATLSISHGLLSASGVLFAQSVVNFESQGKHGRSSSC